MIPLNPAWCTHCRNPKAFGLESGPCPHHRGPNGETVPYTGTDVYRPTAWVMEVVGTSYRHDGQLFRCIGFDPRSGLIMKGVHYPYEEKCVADRAIGRTFHEVRTFDPSQSAKT